ncbi:uncharacterized protein [Macrobrachium rosenbergii]|uniref:uncharacterized protein n=1 Tax=Macrobrachium rosenbergii TaxID=79674 RepID=UPI0034D52118
MSEADVSAIAGPPPNHALQVELSVFSLLPVGASSVAKQEGLLLYLVVTYKSPPSPLFLGPSDKKLKKGRATGKQNPEGVKNIKSRDKHDILMLTSIPEHAAELVKTGKTNQDRGKEMPQSILDYNAAKNGPDYSSQMSTYYFPLHS